MSRDFQEPEEKDLDTQNAELVDDFSPLDEPIIEKAYTKPNVKINPKDFEGDIPEPMLTPPPMMGSTLNEEEKSKKPQPQQPINKEYNQLSNKDKNDASERLVDMCISGYEALNMFADKKIQFDERKLNKMAQEGEIDLNMEVPITPNQSVTLQEFVQEYNEQSKGTISVSKEFKEEIKPPLMRIFAKRGVGMTDEQYVGYILLKDMIGKGFIISQSLGVKKEYLNMFKEQFSLLRQGASMPTPPPPTNSTPPPPPPQTKYEEQTQPIYEHNPQTNVNDFVNQMTGGYVPPQPNVTDMEVNSDLDFREENQIVEEKPIMTIIDNTTTKGKRGRPKRK